MLDVDTFLLQLYVWIDDHGKSVLPAPEPPRPGPAAELSRSEVLTLALFSQWGVFASERAFYRYAQRHLRAAFPRLPERSRFNRLLRRHGADLARLVSALARCLVGVHPLYEVVDTTPVVVRSAKRRGQGWLAGQADVSWSNRLGWFEGLRLLTCVTPEGVLTGFGLASASTGEHALVDTFLAARHAQPARLSSAGQSRPAYYVGDKGLQGQRHHQRWRSAYAAVFIAPVGRQSHTPWPRPLRRWLAGIRQIAETLHERLNHTFRLEHERPHELSGVLARVAAMGALHNFCIWLNRQLGRPALAFADLVQW